MEFTLLWDNFKIRSKHFIDEKIRVFSFAIARSLAHSLPLPVSPVLLSMCVRVCVKISSVFSFSDCISIRRLPFTLLRAQPTSPTHSSISVLRWWWCCWWCLFGTHTSSIHFTGSLSAAYVSLTNTFIRLLSPFALHFVAHFCTYLTLLFWYCFYSSLFTSIALMCICQFYSCSLFSWFSWLFENVIGNSNTWNRRMKEMERMCVQMCTRWRLSSCVYHVELSTRVDTQLQKWWSPSVLRWVACMR